MKVSIVGLGLIGGSLLKAAERAGYDTLALHHSDTPDLHDTDILFIALPPKSIKPWIEKNESTFKEGMIAVDVCGVKRPVFDEFKTSQMTAKWVFIPGHPMAGKEVNGFKNADADLFKGASMILTPYPFMGRKPLDILVPVLKDLGFGKIVSTTPDNHDKMIAYTSQLCHVLSGAYAQEELIKEHEGYNAGSFRDMTRIASMDPETWSDLFLENADHLEAVTDRYAKCLEEFCTLLKNKDREGIKAWIERGAANKKEFVK